MSDVRLIERWLPIAEIGVEGLRERTPMTPFPAPNRLHVWWARRPLVASRAAVLASLLPADADHAAFIHALGIHGDPLAARRRIAAADRNGERLGKDAYGYPRAFSYLPTQEDLLALNAPKDATVLDPTAGGGAIPFEAMRLGYKAYANDLNPVAATILRATVDLPHRLGKALLSEYEAVGIEFRARLRAEFKDAFPDEPVKDTRPDCYLWARTISCPYCSGRIPLSPNWRLNAAGLGIKVVPDQGSGVGSAGRVCSFEIVEKLSQHSDGTVSGGDATCPFSDCARVVDGEEVKRQAQIDGLGEQLFAVVFKRRVETRLKSGKLGKPKWVRGYRSPQASDDIAAQVKVRLAQKLPEWEALDIVPNEEFPADTNDDRPRQYGMPLSRLIHGNR